MSLEQQPMSSPDHGFTNPPITILIIDDNHDDARLIRRDLSGAGRNSYYTVHHTDSIKMGLARLEQGGIDIILLDLGMPESSGLSAFDTVQTQAPAVPIIVLTGNDDDDLAIKAAQKGAQDYLVKGQTSGLLLQRAIRYAIERKRTEMELKRLNELLERQATTDPLTGISNRLKFNEVLDAEVQRAKRYAMPLSLIMFDIDRFKLINDTHGHDIGDRVLRELTALVKGNIRVNDSLARWGGEEFMILAANTTLENARLFAEGLRSLIAGHSFQDVGRVTCSFGIARLLDESSDQLLQRVDRALYSAKENGRDRVEIA
jgi:diguanylate cyclase (GGDEF)-like protein